MSIVLNVSFPVKKAVRYEIVGDCWECVSHEPNDQGYIRVGFAGKYRLHRVVFKDRFGREPEGVIRHKCDNRKCINPDHLEEGSKADNSKDMMARRRNNPVKKISDEDVLVIYKLKGTGLTGVQIGELAEKYGVKSRAIYSIWEGYDRYDVTGLDPVRPGKWRM